MPEPLPIDLCIAHVRASKAFYTLMVALGLLILQSFMQWNMEVDVSVPTRMTSSVTSRIVEEVIPEATSEEEAPKESLPQVEVAEAVPQFLRKPEPKQEAPTTLGPYRGELVHDANDTRLRYLSFGTSITWGAGIEDRHRAYPWLLSEDKAVNLAIRASGPNYPANCASTMIRDNLRENEDPHVITLEFFQRAGSGLHLLARRLRQRFPDALIVFVKNWNPTMIANNKNNNIVTWALDHHYEKGTFLHSLEFHRDFLVKADELEWSCLKCNDQALTDMIEETAREVGGVISELPLPADIRDWISMAHLFAPDGVHLSEHGHMDVAERIRAIVAERGVPIEPRASRFAYDDVCENWFETGELSEHSRLEFGDNGHIVQIPHTVKYALEFEGGTGWLRVHNEADVEQAVYVGFMATGPSPYKYPVTEVRKEGDDIHNHVHLHTDADQVYGDAPVHISKLTEIATIPANSSIKFWFSPLEEKEWPFRIVSVIITSRAEGSDGLASSLPGGNENQ